MDHKIIEFLNLFTKPAGNTETMIAMKPKRLSDETIKPLTAPSNNLAPKLKGQYSSKKAKEFNGRCLKQDKATLNPKNVLNMCIVYKSDLCSIYLRSFH